MPCTRATMHVGDCSVCAWTDYASSLASPTLPPSRPLPPLPSPPLPTSLLVQVMVVLIREFQSPDEEMKKIVLKVVKQCVGTNGVEPDYICTEILPEYFKQFWVHRMALDRRNYKQLVETTVEIANKHSTDGVEPDYTRTEILPEYFKHFWVRRMVLDKRNYKQLVETTVEIANKQSGVIAGQGGSHLTEDLEEDHSQPSLSSSHLFLPFSMSPYPHAGAGDTVGRVVEDLKDEREPPLASTLDFPHSRLSSPPHTTPHPLLPRRDDIIGRVVEDLKDESEPYRRMVMETVEKVLTNLGATDIDARLEELLIDGILYAFQEQLGG
ncbi:unnamed protein product [Closterium sp. NIES-53]